MSHSHWDESFLNRMRSTGDAPADTVVETFIRSGQVRGLNDILGKVPGKGETLANAPSPLREFLEQTSQLPTWADTALIHRAQELFTLHGPLFGVVMLFKSLPILYAGGRGGAQVLAMTGKLTHHYRQRASETLRFILDVMEPDGLGPNGHGIRTTQRVRLLHASIRTYAGPTPTWKEHPAWGKPINQEELAGTLLAFSSVTLDGLAALGLSLSQSDQEAYLHAWKVIGHILGVDPQLMPRDMGEARQLWKLMVHRNFCKSPEGILLIRDHQAFMEELLPGGILDHSVPALLRYLMGRKISNSILDLPRATLPFALLLFLRDFLGLERIGFLLFPGLARAAREISVHLMEALQHYWNDGHSQPFSIPSGIAEKNP